jgi:hypothetical protein
MNSGKVPMYWYKPCIRMERFQRVTRKIPHHHDTPRTRSLIHESCHNSPYTDLAMPALSERAGETLMMTSIVNRRSLPCMCLGALRVITFSCDSKLQSPKGWAPGPRVRQRPRRQRPPGCPAGCSAVPCRGIMMIARRDFPQPRLGARDYEN